MTVKVNNAVLQNLLTISKRKQTVNGKGQSQVDSCILSCDGANVSILSLTRDMTGLTYVEGHTATDGVTSLNPKTLIPIPDIDRVLGILKMHSQGVTLTYDGATNKLKFKSANKQTTLDASLDAKAFSHSTETLKTFREKSMSLAERIDVVDCSYTTADGEKIDATIHYEFDCTELYEALRCDNINGQRLNLYKFEGGGSTLKITVGDPHLGQTTTTLTDKTGSSPKWECEFDGGLDDLFKHFHGQCLISVFDFTKFGQGYRMLINFNNGSWAFHAALLKN